MNLSVPFSQIHSFLTEQTPRGKILRLVYFILLYFLSGILEEFFNFLANDLNDPVNKWLSIALSTSSTGFLRLFYQDISFNHDFQIIINNNACLQILPGCNGFTPSFKILVTLCLYPIILKKKIILFPVTFLIMIFAAIIHLAILIPISYEIPRWYCFAHNWFTRPIFYIFYFSCWLLWERYGW